MTKPLMMIGLLLGGCGTETGNPEGMSVELAYNARSSRPEVVGFDDGAAVVVDTVWLRLDEVTLDGCGAQLETYPGLGMADHAHVEAAAQTLDSSFATFCGVSTLAAPGATDGEPAHIQGASIVVEGHLDSGEAFVLRIDDAVDLGVALDGQTPPAEGSWLLTFDVAAWLDPADLTVLDDEGVVEVNAVPFRERLADGVSLHVDANGNGQVDPGELEVARGSAR